MKFSNSRTGMLFLKPKLDKSNFLLKNFFEIFKELITHTSGDFDEAIDWLKGIEL